MKNNSFIKELIISIIVIALAVILLDPLHWWMPNAMQMMMLVLLTAAFTLFATYVWREHGRDEREHMHIAHAGRVAYLVGSGILTIGIIVQSFNHELDYWIVLALIGMIIAKIIGLVSAQLKH